MERFFGFDLGDAESAVSVLDREDKNGPRVIKVAGRESFVTAYGYIPGRGLTIGEEALYDDGASERHLRFKSRILSEAGSWKDMQSFAAGVLGELYKSGDLVQGEDCCFYVGCPAGWDRNVRERYRALFERIGYPPVRIISESRAALISACRSRHMQVGYDILSHPVLIVDIGSSTTDLAYIRNGRETELKTAGEVFLGGGMLDELLLEECVSASRAARRIRAVFEKSGAWRAYAEFAARRLKEKYFTDEDYWRGRECSQKLSLRYDRRVDLTLTMNAGMAERILEGRIPALNGRSFHGAFVDCLMKARARIGEESPELIFLTGGVSRMPAVPRWCREVYPEAIVITEKQPEFSVSRGLAWSGLIDEDLKAFRAELDDFVNSSVIEQIVRGNINELYVKAVDALTEPILQKAALPVIKRWQSGELRLISDIEGVMEKEITAFMHSEEARELLVAPVAEWLRPVAYAIEEHTVPICVHHGVPHRALSLKGYMSLSDVDLHLNAKDVFAVDQIALMVDTVVSLIVGLLCGGSGVVLIAEGLPGIITGSVIALLVLLLGQEWVEKAIMDVNIPVAMRRLLPKKYIEKHLDRIKDDIRAKFYDSLQKEESGVITDKLAAEISRQLEECLNKMAEVVEIPLG